MARPVSLGRGAPSYRNRVCTANRLALFAQKAQKMIAKRLAKSNPEILALLLNGLGFSIQID